MGTGKTETVKDMAKLCGQECVVINCSDQLTVEDQLAQIHKGWCGTGCWICFDEYNRMLPEVLEANIKNVLELLN
jgi:dynein heavy chain